MANRVRFNSLTMDVDNLEEMSAFINNSLQGVDLRDNKITVVVKVSKQEGSGYFEGLGEEEWKRRTKVVYNLIPTYYEGSGEPLPKHCDVSYLVTNSELPPRAVRSILDRLVAEERSGIRFGRSGKGGARRYVRYIN